jgi:hypothetical protein
MNVGELRKTLEGLPDDMPVYLEYDGGCEISGPAALACVVNNPSRQYIGRWGSALEDKGPGPERYFLIPDHTSS